MSDAPHPLPTPRLDDTVRAAFWMIGSVGSFSAMAVAGREVSFAFDTFEIMMYRSIIGLVVVLIAGGLFGTLRQVTWRTPGLHAIRNVAHFTGQNLWFYALTVIPLAQVFALEFTSPLWALLLAPLVLGERLTARRVIAACVGFAGILIVTRPSPETLDWGIAAAATAAVGFAITAIFTRKLTRTETLTCILLWMTALQAVFGLVCAGVDGDIALPDIVSLPWLVVIALGGLIAHTCLTKALSLAPATVVMPVDFARLPIIAVIGMLFYGESLDLLVFLGAALIFAANYANIWLSTRQRL